MKKFILLAAATTLAACSQSEDADTPTMDDAVNEMVTDEATPAAMSLNGTTWEWDQDGTGMVVSIDADGNYITETAEGGHIDHGTYVQTEAGDCFTSSMNDEGPECWTTAENVEIGASDDSSSDKGNSGTFTRVEYRELSMPGA